MNRKDGDFYSKGKEENRIKPELSETAERRFNQLIKREGVLAGLAAMNEIEPDQSDQHEKTSGKGEEDKFDSGINPLFMAPDADQEEHRNDLYLPEQVKKEEVCGQKDPQDRCFHKE